METSNNFGLTINVNQIEFQYNNDLKCVSIATKYPIDIAATDKTISIITWILNDLKNTKLSWACDHDWEKQPGCTFVRCSKCDAINYGHAPGGNGDDLIVYPKKEEHDGSPCGYSTDPRIALGKIAE